MNNKKPRTLKELHNRATRYEVAISLCSGETFTAEYMVRKNRNSLIAVARDNADHILALMPEGNESEWSYSTKEGLRFDRFARVYFTGRTERDVAALALETA